jgi:hypothetical protein
MMSLLGDFSFNGFHPLAYVASLAGNDMMNFAEAMKQDDHDNLLMPWRRKWLIIIVTEKSIIGPKCVKMPKTGGSLWPSRASRVSKIHLVSSCNIM